MINKLKELKQAIKNTPPERLAQIEYRSHFMQILGVMAVCTILIWKGLWYIIFAFVFSLGVSYSQGVGAYQKYLAIKEIVGGKYNPNKDKSPSRRRDYIIRQVFGGWISWVTIILSVVGVYFWFPMDAWYTKFAAVMAIFFIYIIIYYFIIYWFANSIYCKEVKNGKKEKRRNNGRSS